MEKLTAMAMKLATAEQKKLLSPAQMEFIQRRLHQAFPAGLRTPNHPPYSSMIEEAIMELNEEGGSTEESISEYIKANYEDLPWAYKSCLSHHLNLLCEQGYIVFTAGKCYLIPGLTREPLHRRRALNQKCMMKEVASSQENAMECRTIEESLFENEEFMVVNEEKRKRARRKLVFNEDYEHMRFDCHDIEDEHVTRSCEIQVVEQYPELKEQEREVVDRRSDLEEYHVESFDCHDIENEHITSIWEIQVVEECLELKEQERKVVDRRSDLEEYHVERFDCHDIENEHITSSYEIQVVEECLEQKEQEREVVERRSDLVECHVERFEGEFEPEEQRDAVIAKLSLFSLDNEGATIASDPMMISDKGESSKVVAKRKKRRVISWEGGVIVYGLPAQVPKQEQLKHTITRQKKTKRQPKKSKLDASDPFPSSKLHEHENQQEGLTLKGQETKIIDHKERTWPSWVQSLVQTSFFDKCKVHSNAENSKCIAYCLNCMNGALCIFCLTSHKDHHVLRIWRGVYEEAINISKIRTYLDIAGIQTHVVGPSKVISLKRSVPSRRRNGVTGACSVCKRHLPDSFKFCSLRCKNEHEVAAAAAHS